MFVSLPAAGREPTAEDIKTARRLFQEAAELQREEKWAEALERLQAAIAVKETPGLRFHLAYCQEKLGRLVEAMAEYDRAEKLVRSGMAAPDVEDLLEPARIALKKRIPTLTVNLPAGADATLRIDGQTVDVAAPGEAISLNAGAHDVTIEAPGYEPFRVEVFLREGKHRVLNANLVPLREEPPTASASTPTDPRRETSASSTRDAVLIGAASGTLVALGVGIGYTLTWLSADRRVERGQSEVDEAFLASQGTDHDDDVTKACTDPTGPLESACTRLRSALEERSRNRTIATIGYTAAAVGAAATVGTFFLWRPSDEAPMVRAGVAPAPGGGFMSTVSGSF